jgi:hypothetical protein
LCQIVSGSGFFLSLQREKKLWKNSVSCFPFELQVAPLHLGIGFCAINFLSLSSSVLLAFLQADGSH